MFKFFDAPVMPISSKEWTEFFLTFHVAFAGGALLCLLAASWYVRNRMPGRAPRFHV